MNGHLAPPWPQRYLGLSFGWAGVDLFFVLSGFLITGILRRLRGDSDYYPAFYSRRARRILPPAVLILAASSAVAADAGRFSWPLFGMYATFTTSLVPSGWWFAQLALLPRISARGLGLMWTLSVEEIFYFLWAPVVRRCSMSALAAICVGAIVVAPPMRLWLHAPGSPEQYFFLTRMDALAWGAVAALALEGDARRLARRSSLVAAVAILALVTIFLLTDHGDVGHRLFAVAGYTILDAACAAVVVAAVTQPSRWRWLRQPALTYAGTISYSLYLVHWPISQLIGMITGGAENDRTTLRIVLTLSLSALVASASWRYLEAPLLNRGASRTARYR